MNKNFYQSIFLFVLLLNSSLSIQAQTASSYLSYDWAFFELKGRVRAVTIIRDGDNSCSETHYFNRDGELQNEEAGSVLDDDFNSDGYVRDDKGRIVGAGNTWFSWTWNGKTVVRMDWGHLYTYFYLYNQEGKRIGYKDEKGKIHKYVYMVHDAKGNWTYRVLEHDSEYSEKRKIVYY